MQHHVLELTAAVGLAFGAQQDLPAVGLDRAARQIEGRAPDRPRDLIEGQAVASQGLLRDLDRDLIGTRRHQLHLGDAVKVRDLVAHLLAQSLQGALVDVAGDGDR